MSDIVISDRPGGCGCGGTSHVSPGSGCGCGGSKDESHVGCGCGGRSHAGASHMEARACSRRWRRFHAALGAALTIFLVMHLGIAVLSTRPSTFESIATRLHAWTSFLPALPFVLLGLLAVESASGIRVLLRGKPAMRRDESPWRLFAQRWTGAVVLVFLVVHTGMALLRGPGNTPAAAGAALFAGSSVLVGFYAFCVVAIAWHAGHGMWTGASIWGFRDKRPAFWWAVAVITGLLLAILGFTALRALSA